MSTKRKNAFLKGVKEDLPIIAEATIASPSEMNRQLWRVVVVKNREFINELETKGMKNLVAMPDESVIERIISRGSKLYYNAPCMIVVPIAKTEPTRAEVFDCGIVAENIALAATSLGIENLICDLPLSPSPKRRCQIQTPSKIPQRVRNRYCCIARIRSESRR